MILIVNHILIDNKMGEEVRHSQQKKLNISIDDENLSCVKKGSKNV